MDRVPGFEPGGWRFEPSSVQIPIRVQLSMRGEKENLIQQGVQLNLRD